LPPKVQKSNLTREIARSIFVAKGDPALDIKAALTKIRVKELRHDPVGLD